MNKNEFIRIAGLSYSCDTYVEESESFQQYSYQHLGTAGRPSSTKALMRQAVDHYSKPKPMQKGQTEFGLDQPKPSLTSQSPVPSDIASC